MSQDPIEERVRGALGIITEEETAKVLMLNSVSTLATWRSQGKGPMPVKLGKRVFYTLTDIGEWIGKERLRQAANDNQKPAVAA